MTKGIKSFTAFTDAQSEQYLAVHVPPGKLTAKRFDKTSNLYKLFYILADFIKQITIQISIFINNLNISNAIELLPELESSLGIPTNIPRLSTIAQRQAAVLLLRSKIPVYNVGSIFNVKQGGNYALVSQGYAGDIRTTFEYYVLILTSISITITFLQNTTSKLPASFPIPFSLPYNVLSNIWIINVKGSSVVGNNTFPCSFPVVFGTSVTVPTATQNLLTTVLERVIPSYVSYSYNGIQ